MLHSVLKEANVISNNGKPTRRVTFWSNRKEGPRHTTRPCLLTVSAQSKVILTMSADNFGACITNVNTLLTSSIVIFWGFFLSNVISTGVSGVQILSTENAHQQNMPCHTFAAVGCWWYLSADIVGRQDDDRRRCGPIGTAEVSVTSYGNGIASLQVTFTSLVRLKNVILWTINWRLIVDLVD